ncbi:hypothetical protein DES53_11047 [Roseimicrobium gellanilyticum]|uniref:Uncharacterized protein n=1 Tax=Roseimicrobium gellanilyticum TaxID=748857 RepID=A0A366HBK2_9BACT|nr:hypothetical protein [Roseimicrobium gellanilyticum]RBP39024.1 hypothetical protein DES53_11047 [Roseimicrobium gellanilyticum]
MTLWTILKRTWYVVVYNGRFSFKPAEKALLDAVIAKLPEDDASALQAQLRSMNCLQRFFKRQLVCFRFRRYKGPLLSKKDSPCCVALVTVRMDGESVFVNLVSMHGLLRILYIPAPLRADASLDVADVVVFPLHHSPQGKEQG